MFFGSQSYPNLVEYGQNIFCLCRACLFLSSTNETYLAWVEHGQTHFSVEHSQNISSFGSARSSTFDSVKHSQNIPSFSQAQSKQPKFGQNDGNTNFGFGRDGWNMK